MGRHHYSVRGMRSQNEEYYETKKSANTKSRNSEVGDREREREDRNMVE